MSSPLLNAMLTPHSWDERLQYLLQIRVHLTRRHLTPCSLVRLWWRHQHGLSRSNGLIRYV